MSLLELLQNRGITPRKTSLNHGGEYSSACPGPACQGAGVDRFHIWPDRDSGGKVPGRFWCRQCGISGDPIAFLQTVEGLTFPQACAELGIALDHGTARPRSRYQAPPRPMAADAPWQPKIYDEPGEVWREKAENLLTDCQERLASMPEALAWLAERGISRDVARAYGLGYNLSSKGKDRYRPRSLWGLPEKEQADKSKRLWIPRGWVIPAYNNRGQLNQLRIRRIPEDIAAFAHRIKYLPIDGSSMATMVLHPNAEVFVVVECGFDAIVLAALTDGKIGAVTTWNSAARPDAGAHALLAGSSCILGGLDYDQGGDREQPWWQGQYRQYHRLPALPGGIKDPGDGAKAGVDLYAWMTDGLPRGLQIKLGFSKPRRAKPKVEAEPRQDTQPVGKQDQEEVVEVELANGKVVYVTNDQARWKELAAQGLPVFSQHELERLRAALVGLVGEDRDQAILRTIEAKELFGGYVRRGGVVA